MGHGLETALSELKKYRVIDSNGNEVGNPIDVVFDIKKDLATKLVLGGSFIEELKEKLGLKPDDDPVVSLTHIDKVQNKIIKLNVTAEDLPNKLETDAISKNEQMFSQIKNFVIVDTEGNEIGRPIDIIIHSDNGISFIIGDSIFQEFLEKIGFTPDFDLLLPFHDVQFIDTPSKKIKIKSKKEHLQTILDGLPLKDAIDRLNTATMASKEAEIMRFKIQ